MLAKQDRAAKQLLNEDELNTWLERSWKISSLRFLRKDTAPKVITALKAMKARAA